MSTRGKGLLDKWRKNRELLPLETLEELCWKLQKEMTLSIIIQLATIMILCFYSFTIYDYKK